MINGLFATDFYYSFECFHQKNRIKFHSQNLKRRASLPMAQKSFFCFFVLTECIGMGREIGGNSPIRPRYHSFLFHINGMGLSSIRWTLSHYIVFVLFAFGFKWSFSIYFNKGQMDIVPFLRWIIEKNYKNQIF